MIVAYVVVLQMRLCVLLLVAALGCLSQQTAGKPIGMEDTIADVVSRILEGSDKGVCSS